MLLIDPLVSEPDRSESAFGNECRWLPASRQGSLRLRGQFVHVVSGYPALKIGESNGTGMAVLRYVSF